VILDYSQYVEDEEFTRATVYHGVTHRTDPSVPELFFKRGECPFCKRPAPQVHMNTDEVVRCAGDGYGFMTLAWQCPCGWWQTYSHTWGDETGLSVAGHRTRSAILRRFEPTDAALPIEAVRRELVTKPSLLHEIGHEKMEQLVASVFADYYECDVEHVGRSGDQGIDLYVILGDKTTMVQVKRRRYQSSRFKSEPVEAVREFLGATLLQGSRDAIFVTNAEAYSPGAVDTARRALTLELVRSFELLNGDHFLRRLGLVQERLSPVWQRNLRI